MAGFEKCPTVLDYIAGCKKGNPTLKIFLSRDKEEAQEFLKENRFIPSGTVIEFVNVNEKSTKLKDQKKSNESFLCLDEKNIHLREMLAQTIKNESERVYAIHSNVVGIGIGTRKQKDCNLPCIILFTYDKDIIPFGEKTLPKFLNGWKCKIREDIAIFGGLFDSYQRNQPNPQLLIPIPSKFISLGFLAKTQRSKLETYGYLTAAHVITDQWTDLYHANSFLSELNLDQFLHEDVHRALSESHQNHIFEKIEESFCGNWGKDDTGIDAAFVKINPKNKKGINVIVILIVTILFIYFKENKFAPSHVSQVELKKFVFLRKSHLFFEISNFHR